MIPQNPSAGGNGERPTGEVVGEADGETVGRDVTCALFSLLLTIGLLAVAYPAAVSVWRPSGYLASTVLVGALVVVWLATWTCVETVWTRRVAGPNGS
jgi:hypothetical protein